MGEAKVYVRLFRIGLVSRQATTRKLHCQVIPRHRAKPSQLRLEVCVFDKIGRIESRGL